MIASLTIPLQLISEQPRSYRHHLAFALLAWIATRPLHQACPDGMVEFSVREICKPVFGCSYKQLRSALDFLVRCGCIEKEEGFYTRVRLAFSLAQFEAQQMAQDMAQADSPLRADNQPLADIQADIEGAGQGILRAQIKASRKRVAQRKAQARAQAEAADNTDNVKLTSSSSFNKGASNGTSSDKIARRKEKNNEKETFPSALLSKEKENKKEKEESPPHTPNIYKLSRTAGARAREIDFNAILQLWNYTFQGTKVKRITRITEQRQQLIEQYCATHGEGSIQKLLSNTLHSPMLIGKTKGHHPTSFNWVFDPDNAQQILEGTWLDDGSLNVAPSAQQPQQPQRSMTEAEKQQAERTRIEEILRRAQADPSSHCVGVAREMQRNGTLARYGLSFPIDAQSEDERLSQLSQAFTADQIIQGDPNGRLAKILNR